MEGERGGGGVQAEVSSRVESFYICCCFSRVFRANAGVKEVDDLNFGAFLWQLRWDCVVVNYVHGDLNPI